MPAPLLAACLLALLGGCAGITSPAPAAAAGALARGPLTSSLPAPTSVGPADTGPAGSAAAVGDGSAIMGGHR